MGPSESKVNRMGKLGWNLYSIPSTPNPTKGAG